MSCVLKGGTWTLKPERADEDIPALEAHLGSIENHPHRSKTFAKLNREGFFVGKEGSTMRVALILILCSLFFAVTATADEIMLHNGRVLQGNIITIDEGKGEVVLDVVLHHELIGMKMVLRTSEVKSIRRGDDYQHLVKKEISPEQQLQNQQALQRATEAAADIDQAILSRIQREIEHNRYVNQKQEEQRRFREELEHQKQMHQLELEAQKEIITHSQKEGANTDVNIFRGL